MERFAGRWKHVEAQNVDGMAKAIGLPDDVCKWVAAAKPEVEFQQDGDTWLYTVKIEEFLKKYSFVLDKETITEAMNGSKMKTLITLEGSKLTELHTGMDDPDLQLEGTREICGDQLVQVYTHKKKGITSIHRYKRA